MIVENLTPEIELVKEGETWVIKLGTVKKGTSHSFKYLIKDITHRGNAVSCGGCTKADGKQVGSDVELDIIFSANSKGNVSKTAKELTTDGQEIVFKIEGKII